MAVKYKRNPYGLSNFFKLRRENRYYVDRTRFIRILEESGDYFFFIRPRRMGKSLWLSVLECYHDVRWRDDFDDLFKGLEIAADPEAPEHNTFLILKFNFSKVNPDIERVKDSFETYINIVVQGFAHNYKEYLDDDFFVETGKLNTGLDKLSYLFDYATRKAFKLYIIVDEYDNFTNTILATRGESEYRKITRDVGFFRYFFNLLKGVTGEVGTGDVRMFITGVSPITMDDVTSGNNIGKHISLDPQFNEIMGFTEDEVREILLYYQSQGRFPLDVDESLEIMREWYNNYRFANGQTTNLYNTDMALYYLDQVERSGKMPEKMIDRNVRVDYGKLRHLVLIDRQISNDEKRLNGNFSRLKQIMETGWISSEVSDGFLLERLTRPENFVSLLYYFGLLTFAEPGGAENVLCIPNRTVQSLMYGHFRDAIDDANTFRLDLHRLENLVREMAQNGLWEEFFDFLAREVESQTAVRDYLHGEKVIQGFLLAYLNVTNYFLSRTEFEAGKGFCDFFLEPFTSRYPDVKFAYLIELKYIPRSENEPENLKDFVAQKVEEAGLQLERYASDETIQNRLHGAELIKIVLVFRGWELVERRRVG